MGTNVPVVERALEVWPHVANYVNRRLIRLSKQSSDSQSPQIVCDIEMVVRSQCFITS